MKKNSRFSPDETVDPKIEEIINRGSISFEDKDGLKKLIPLNGIGKFLRFQLEFYKRNNEGIIDHYHGRIITLSENFVDNDLMDFLKNYKIYTHKTPEKHELDIEVVLNKLFKYNGYEFTVKTFNSTQAIVEVKYPNATETIHETITTSDGTNLLNLFNLIQLKFDLKKSENEEIKTKLNLAEIKERTCSVLNQIFSENHSEVVENPLPSAQNDNQEIHFLGVDSYLSSSDFSLNRIELSHLLYKNHKLKIIEKLFFENEQKLNEKIESINGDVKVYSNKYFNDIPKIKLIESFSDYYDTQKTYKQIKLGCFDNKGEKVNVSDALAFIGYDIESKNNLNIRLIPDSNQLLNEKDCKMISNAIKGKSISNEYIGISKNRKDSSYMVIGLTLKDSKIYFQEKSFDDREKVIDMLSDTPPKNACSMEVFVNTIERTEIINCAESTSENSFKHNGNELISNDKNIQTNKFVYFDKKQILDEIIEKVKNEELILGTINEEESFIEALIAAYICVIIDRKPIENSALNKKDINMLDEYSIPGLSYRHFIGIDFGGTKDSTIICTILKNDQGKWFVESFNKIKDYRELNDEIKKINYSNIVYDKSKSYLIPLIKKGKSCYFTSNVKEIKCNSDLLSVNKELIIDKIIQLIKEEKIMFMSKNVTSEQIDNILKIEKINDNYENISDEFFALIYAYIASIEEEYVVKIKKINSVFEVVSELYNGEEKLNDTRITIIAEKIEDIDMNKIHNKIKEINKGKTFDIKTFSIKRISTIDVE